ncbi:unnamed protein product [Rotaria sp. Silwood2]|nr:unnamed protein product [Rotaria sp. Silwood2]CAF2697011.1 unnamed protein product [Rotaria sp. Silwood2]CAF3920148.1 unnamed protein product [Rotaria sp. Silwood2]CAF4372381.1 unnamed protein product [Rotaria sp. Silwood2]
MLPVYNIYPMPMSMNPERIGVLSAIAPLMSNPAVPILCPSNQTNAHTSTTMPNKYYSHMYGRCQNLRQDHSHYSHVPFEWYQPPKQGYTIIHEEIAVITFDRPAPIDKFHRYYIHCKHRKVCNHNDDTQESSYEQRSIDHQRYTRTESDFDDNDDDDEDEEEEEENTSLPNYEENQSHTDDSFSYTNSVNSSYDN